MPVRLKDSTARKIARLLDRMDSALEAEYGSGEPEAQHLAEELRQRAGPPREPIRQWVDSHRDRLGLDSEDAVESVTDQIVATIEGYGNEQDSPVGDLL